MQHIVQSIFGRRGYISQRLPQHVGACQHRFLLEVDRHGMLCYLGIGDALLASHSMFSPSGQAHAGTPFCTLGA